MATIYSPYAGMYVFRYICITNPRHPSCIQLEKKNKARDGVCESWVDGMVQTGTYMVATYVHTYVILCYAVTED